MENEDLKVNITVANAADGTPAKVIVLTGDAPTANDPVGYEESNLSVKSVLEFVKKRGFKEIPADNKGVVVFSDAPDKPYIEFDTDVTDERSIKLNSALVINPDLVEFGINKDRYFNQKQFELLVKKCAHCFESVEDAQGLIKNLRNFEVKFEQQVKRGDDRQGNKEDAFKEAIKFVAGELPKELKLRLPFYKNTDPQSFTVEIEIEKESGSNLPKFGFYSMDMELKFRKAAEDLINAEINELTKYFPCLEK